MVCKREDFDKMLPYIQSEKATTSIEFRKLLAICYRYYLKLKESTKCETFYIRDNFHRVLFSNNEQYLIIEIDGKENIIDLKIDEVELSYSFEYRPEPIVDLLMDQVFNGGYVIQKMYSESNKLLEAELQWLRSELSDYNRQMRYTTFLEEIFLRRNTVRQKSISGVCWVA